MTTPVGGHLDPADAPTEMSGFAEAETDSAYAWGAIDYDDAVPTQRLTPRRITTAAVATSLTIVAAATTVAWFYLRDKPHDAQESISVAVPTVTRPAPVATPTPPKLSGVNAEFIAELKRFDVPVNDLDPQWNISMADAVCKTGADMAPGTHAILLLTNAVMENNPSWDKRQASRFTNSAIDHYCPKVAGPSQDEINAMPPDARYLARLQDRIGITPTDNTLIGAAHQICEWQAQGWTVQQMTDAINSPNPPDDERIIVETATDVYCPQYG